jgi:hypothetical protein
MLGDDPSDAAPKSDLPEPGRAGSFRGLGNPLQPDNRPIYF